MIAKTLSSKNVLPILDCIVFRVEGNSLHLTAADPENMMTMTVATDETDGEGDFAVNAKNIIEGIKNLPEIPVRFNTDEDGMVKVSYQSGMFSLPTWNTDEYPAMPALGETTVCFNIHEDILQENIARTVFATADDELRPVMNTVCFDLTTESLNIVASDGHQLVRNRILTISTNDTNTGMIMLPVKPAMILKNLLGKNENEVHVESDGRRVVITTEDFTLNSRIVEGRYPNYNSVIPLNNPYIVKVNRTQLLNMLKRTAPFANDASKMTKLHIETDSLSVEAEDWDFNKCAKEIMKCDYSGPELTIGMKGTSISEILSNIKCEEVEFHFADPSRAALIMPSEQPEGQEIVMLQMPMLIND